MMGKLQPVVMARRECHHTMTSKFEAKFAIPACQESNGRNEVVDGSIQFIF